MAPTSRACLEPGLQPDGHHLPARDSYGKHNALHALRASNQGQDHPWERGIACRRDGVRERARELPAALHSGTRLCVAVLRVFAGAHEWAAKHPVPCPCPDCGADTGPRWRVTGKARSHPSLPVVRSVRGRGPPPLGAMGLMPSQPVTAADPGRLSAPATEDSG
jgi:hypothetical protein